MPVVPLTDRDLRDDAVNGLLLKVNEIVGASPDVGWTTLLQASNQDVTNAQDQDSDTLAFPVTAGTDYVVRMQLFVTSSNSANDYEFRFAVAAGTMLGRGYATTLNASDVVALTAMSAVAAANTNQVPVGTFTGLTSGPIPVTVTFAFQPSNTTTFKLQFGSNVAAPGISARTRAGSYLQYKSI